MRNRLRSVVPINATCASELICRNSCRLTTGVYSSGTPLACYFCNGKNVTDIVEAKQAGGRETCAARFLGAMIGGTR